MGQFVPIDLIDSAAFPRVAAERMSSQNQIANQHQDAANDQHQHLANDQHQNLANDQHQKLVNNQNQRLANDQIQNLANDQLQNLPNDANQAKLVTTQHHLANFPADQNHHNHHHNHHHHLANGDVHQNMKLSCDQHEHMMLGADQHQPPTTTDHQEHFDSGHCQVLAGDNGQVARAGFYDCTQEAIRFLLEEEHLLESDPLVVGLKQHLWEREQELEYEALMNSYRLLDDSCWKDSQQCQVDFSEGSTTYLPGQYVQFAAQIGDTSDLDQSATSSECQMDLSDSSLVSHDDSAIVCEPLAEDDQTILKFALLAQNNPDIARLTGEIVSLLQEEITGCRTSSTFQSVDANLLDGQ